MAQSFPVIINRPAPGTSYFTPAQYPPAGAVYGVSPDSPEVPTLFKPIKIRGVEFHNRIFLSPLCQYSADDGKVTMWHYAHIGGIMKRGPGLSFVEATAVLPEGRISPEDLGLWKDEQEEPMRKLVEFAHAQGQKIGIQLSHAGRKASVVAPWLSVTETAAPEAGGWPDNLWGPSAVAYSDASPVPNELTKDGITAIKTAFVAAASRAVRVGFDVIEIHNAHGYLLHEFVSPVSNKRTDEYGGSFENRTRLTLEIIDALRKTIPPEMPLFLRISASDWLEESMPQEPSWRIEDTVRLAGLLADHGVDLLDISSAGNHPKQKIDLLASTGTGRAVQDVATSGTYQTHFSEAVKKAHGHKLLVGVVGAIKTGKVAQAVLDKGQADICFVGRTFQRDPASVWTFAEELGVEVHAARQIEWAFRGRGGRQKKAQEAAEDCSAAQ